ncbi:glycoside hydrolase family 16 protein [Curtobacterium sp. ISL-83]|uniref:glycoside hydrolase family 16 protein n=1 Tax=Curtobacterium sp. ISL-83 TaxID=2819145 RepID=UPI001BEC915A|nr:glycoside hydrolase family 16 protein [Curtobacterium sp. ISL-83]MBT2501262.1 glycoside hydrolase family 16 protein [Curtobacterium sp. ISL-83]
MRTPIVVAVTAALVTAGAVTAVTPAPSSAATVPPSSRATATVTNPTTLPVGNTTTNGRVWKQSYRQDFTTAAPLGSVGTKYPGMGTYSGFGDTSGKGRYAPDKVLSVRGGVLDFAVHSEHGQPLVAAVMPDGYAPHTTGRVTIRYKTTKTDGYKFVGMLWPSSDDWNEGEVDWPESDLGDRPRPASAVPGTETPLGMRFEPGTQMFAPTDTTGWHDATTEWDKGVVRFYWDGKLVASTTKAVPKTAFRVTLQAETTIGSEPVPTNAVGHVDIDWISIWN